LSLVDLSILKRAWNYATSDFAAVMATILLTLGVGVEAGIVAGVALSILLHLYKSSRPHIAILGRVPGTEHFRNIKRHAVETEATLLSIRVDESLFFANARFLEDQVYAAIAEYPSTQNLVLVCPAINDIDLSALESLESINGRLKDAGVTFHLSEVKGPVMDKLERSGFLPHLTGKVFLSHHQAVKVLQNGAELQPALASPQRSPPDLLQV
jgi:sulfate permease, SulP family